MKFCMCALLLLAACAPQGTIVKPMEVDMPVTVYCKLTPLPEPDWNVPRLPQDATLTAIIQALLADDYLSKGYIKQLQAELSACS